MNEEKRNEGTDEARSNTEGQEKTRQGGAAAPGGNAASRARNQTVMLSPEMTGQVRALLGDKEDPSRDPLSELLPPLSSWDKPQPGGNSTPRATGRAGGSDYGTDLSNEQEMSGVNKRPTGKIKPSDKVAMAMPGAASASSPSFSVNPSVARGQGSGSHHPVQVGSISSRPGAEAQRAPKTKIVGFLISFDKSKNGEVFEVRSGRWLLTSRGTEHGEFILIDDESISALHAIIRATDEGKIQVLDQLSEFGTGVTRVGSTEEEEIAGSMTGLNHGDAVRFGKRHFVVCMVPIIEKTAESGSN